MYNSEKNILIAFLLNFFFAIFEFIGGFFTGSISIISDAFHDFLDSISIGISFILEKISKQKPNSDYTFGYGRYSTLGALITTMILIIGSLLMIKNAIDRLINPVSIYYDGMLFFALIGVIVNLFATYFTRGGQSLNQKSVNLHMIEDVIGWIIVFIGAIVMKFSQIDFLDPLMSIVVSIFIMFQACSNFKKIIFLFLDKVPRHISIQHIKENLVKLDGVEEIHHIHVWSLDGINNYATMHIVLNKNYSVNIKKLIREQLKIYGICHVTLEFETKEELCSGNDCKKEFEMFPSHH